MIKSAYLHIPFCDHICHYCDFNKVFLQGQPVDEYLTDDEKRNGDAASRYPTTDLNTVFVGGGTPTSLDEKQLEYSYVKQSMKPCPLIEKGEYTFEANPDDISKEKLEILYDSGVNRFSYWSANVSMMRLLKRIGRTHRASNEVFETIHLATRSWNLRISASI